MPESTSQMKQKITDEHSKAASLSKQFNEQYTPGDHQAAASLVNLGFRDAYKEKNNSQDLFAQKIADAIATISTIERSIEKMEEHKKLIQGSAKQGFITNPEYQISVTELAQAKMQEKLAAATKAMGSIIQTITQANTTMKNIDTPAHRKVNITPASFTPDINKLLLEDNASEQLASIVKDRVQVIDSGINMGRMKYQTNAAEISNIDKNLKLIESVGKDCLKLDEALSTEMASTEKPKGLMGWLKSLFSSKNTSTEQKTTQSILPPIAQPTSNHAASHEKISVQFQTPKSTAIPQSPTPPSAIQTLQNKRDAYSQQICAVNSKLKAANLGWVKRWNLNNFKDELITKRMAVSSEIEKLQEDKDSSALPAASTLSDAAKPTSTSNHTTVPPGAAKTTEASQIPPASLGAQAPSKQDASSTETQRSVPQYKSFLEDLDRQKEKWEKSYSKNDEPPIESKRP